MIARASPQEYLEEIHREVCSHCVEKPQGGPPCAPLGKRCGIELHLPEIIESIRSVRSPLIAPYLEQDREHICATCVERHGSGCPCPMDYLAVLLVQAIETVDARHAAAGAGASTMKEGERAAAPDL